MDTIDNPRGAQAGSSPTRPLEGRFLTLMLDQVEHGMLLVDADGVLRFANDLGRLELGGDGPLELRDGCIVASDRSNQCLLQRVLDATLRGRRQLVTFDAALPGQCISFAPLAADDDAFGQGLAMLVFGKRVDAGRLSIDFFGRSQGLTGAETTVLGQLARGLRPQDIASDHGVAISTIRTQIASIRDKTGAASIRELLDRLALLPPVRSALRPMHRARVPATSATNAMQARPATHWVPSPMPVPVEPDRLVAACHG